MAFRATVQSYWRSTLSRLDLGGINRSLASSASNAAHSHPSHPSKYSITGEFAPMYVMLGIVMVAISIGGHTAKQHLMHSPTLYISKKRRESMPEVEDPDRVIDEADKFVNKSFLRKVAHIQDDNNRTLPDPSRPDPFTRPRNAETLKTAGVKPSRN